MKLFAVTLLSLFGLQPCDVMACPAQVPRRRA